MSLRLFILILLSIFSTFIFGQNKLTEDGLKVGKWEEFYNSSEFGKIKYVTTYKIIHKNIYQFTSPIPKIYPGSSSTIRITFKNKEHLINIYGASNDSISVEDGVQNRFFSNGKTYAIMNYNLGLINSMKFFDTKGKLTKHNYYDYEKDTSMYLTFTGNQIFKKEYYCCNKNNGSITQYYPNSNLQIDNAELFFTSSFFNPQIDISEIKIISKKEQTIESIKSKNGLLNINLPTTLKLPFKILEGDSVKLNLTFLPKPETFQVYDTIEIKAFDNIESSYLIYCKLSASHINNSNLEKLKELTLSKLNDKYLLIQQMATVTDITLTNGSDFEKSYSINGIKKIDLKDFKLGIYNLNISNCHSGGDIKLKIVE